MIRRFEPSDLATVNLWRAARGLRPVAREELPALGFLDEGVAAGFLLRTESPACAMVDGLVTCPSAPLRTRHAAVLGVIAELCAAAKQAGVTRLCAFTQYRGAASVARRAGFRLGPMYHSMQKELS